ncbi:MULTISPECIES: ABC transporter ATP-binding protein [Vagococcus]|uniref:ABC-type multidrug transport system, ATPase component n=1 Tax=Vagococcus fluvialis bH819 TaxID=1255619 RepID=A0A1X6WQR7_9ENTE|nr:MULTISPECIES: ABC transporter ATP-binding protein [Vagococcus]SLM86673.1 ABC-type multidrug transport system, ATPase component [Vagococcus fluvialis bH819]HCM90881.1 ABC transporter ATP-binding protein [Vagococcus sp.]
MKLIIDSLEKDFKGKKVIDQASFEFKKGKIYGLLGRNGAGKTTLFNCISKDLNFDSGHIFLEDNSENKLYKETDIGLVHATPNVPDFMTGYEFIKFFIDMNAHQMKNIRTPDSYLSKVGIKKEDRHRLMKEYSHGMKNKVQMVATMMIQPPVLLLDEPLTSFDVVAAHEMKELILSMKSESVVIFSTHILQLAQDLCDEIVLLHNGKLKGIPAGSIHDLDFEEEIVRLLSEEDGGLRNE